MHDHLDESPENYAEWKTPILKGRMLQADLRDTEGLVLDHWNKENIAIKWVTHIFGFPVQIKLCLHWTVDY